MYYRDTCISLLILGIFTILRCVISLGSVMLFSAVCVTTSATKTHTGSTPGSDFSNEWIQNMGYTYTMEFYSATGRRKLSFLHNRYN